MRWVLEPPVGAPLVASPAAILTRRKVTSFFFNKGLMAPTKTVGADRVAHRRRVLGANPGSGLKLFADAASVKVEREAKSTTSNKVACDVVAARSRSSRKQS